MSAGHAGRWLRARHGMRGGEESGRLTRRGRIGARCVVQSKAQQGRKKCSQAYEQRHEEEGEVAFSYSRMRFHTYL